MTTAGLLLETWERGTVPISQHPEGWGLALPVPWVRPALRGYSFCSSSDKVTRVRKGSAQSGRGSRCGVG